MHSSPRREKIMPDKQPVPVPENVPILCSAFLNSACGRLSMGPALRSSAEAELYYKCLGQPQSFYHNDLGASRNKGGPKSTVLKGPIQGNSPAPVFF